MQWTAALLAAVGGRQEQGGLEDGTRTRHVAVRPQTTPPARWRAGSQSASRASARASAAGTGAAPLAAVLPSRLPETLVLVQPLLARLKSAPPPKGRSPESSSSGTAGGGGSARTRRGAPGGTSARIGAGSGTAPLAGARDSTCSGGMPRRICPLSSSFSEVESSESSMLSPWAGAALAWPPRPLPSRLQSTSSPAACVSGREVAGQLRGREAGKEGARRCESGRSQVAEAVPA